MALDVPKLGCAEQQIRGEKVKLIVSVKDGVIQSSIVSSPPISKHDPAEDVDYHDYLNHPDKVVYLAYHDRKPVGMIRLVRHWNDFAFIEELVVESGCRRRGIGRDLIKEAKCWATNKTMAGVMAETQDTNPAAC